MKVQIKTEFGKYSKVLIDGHNIGNRLMGVDVSLKANCIPVVKLELAPDEIEIEGDFEILKKIPEEKSENKGTEIIINGDKIAECSNSDDIAKAIMDKIKEQSSYR